MKMPAGMNSCPPHRTPHGGDRQTGTHTGQAVATGLCNHSPRAPQILQGALTTQALPCWPKRIVLSLTHRGQFPKSPLTSLLVHRCPHHQACAFLSGTNSYTRSKTRPSFTFSPAPALKPALLAHHAFHAITWMSVASPIWHEAPWTVTHSTLPLVSGT